MERSPTTVSKLDEEEIRDLLLIVLNSHFEGQATGETFNGSGKTDILIRLGGRNVFIGECKIYKGFKTIADAIEQLRGYLVWRDAHAALIVVIRNRRDPTEALRRIVQAIKGHEGFVRIRAELEETSGRFEWTLRHRDDPNQTIRTTLIPIVIRSRDVEQAR